MSYAPVYRAAAEADAILPAIIVVALAKVARMGAAAAPIAYMQLASAMSAAEEPCEKDPGQRESPPSFRPPPSSPNCAESFAGSLRRSPSQYNLHDDRGRRRGTLRRGVSRSDVSRDGRPPARSLPDAVPKHRRRHRRDCAKCRGLGSAKESSRSAAFPGWD